MSWLDGFLTKAIALAGTVLTQQRGVLNMSSAFTVADNPTTGQTDVDLASGAGGVPLPHVVYLAADTAVPLALRTGAMGAPYAGVDEARAVAEIGTAILDAGIYTITDPLPANFSLCAAAPYTPFGVTPLVVINSDLTPGFVAPTDVGSFSGIKINGDVNTDVLVVGTLAFKDCACTGTIDAGIGTISVDGIRQAAAFRTSSGTLRMRGSVGISEGGATIANCDTADVSEIAVFHWNPLEGSGYNGKFRNIGRLFINVSIVDDDGSHYLSLDAATRRGIAPAGTVFTDTTGTLNDFVPTSSPSSAFAWHCCKAAAFNASGSLTITGFALGYNPDAWELTKTIVNDKGSGTITLKHENAGSVAANRIHCDTGADIVLAVGESALLVKDYTASRWRASKL